MINNITKLVKNLLLLIASIVIILVCIEFGFRIFNINPDTNDNIIKLSDTIIKPSDNPRLLYTSKENVPNLTNSYGFHDKEYRLEKTSNKLRIIALGDSVAYGVGGNISINQNFLHILEDETSNVEIINMANSGYNTTQEVELFKLKGLQFNPDVVWVFYVLNDPENDSFELSVLGKDHLLLRNKLKKVPFLEWFDNNSSLWNFTINSLLWVKVRIRVESIINNDANSSLGINNTNSFYQYMHQDKYFNNVIGEFNHLKEMSKKNNFNLKVFIIPELIQYDKYKNISVHLKIKQSLNDMDIDVVDMLPITKENDPSKMRLSKHDYLHLNLEGHRIFANWLKPHIQNEILNYDK